MQDGQAPVLLQVRWHHAIETDAVVGRFSF